MRKLIKQFGENLTGRDFVVSDIHGCWQEFHQKLDEIKFNENTDRMFSVGDLCDRGPFSEKCLHLIYEDWFHAVSGNHEWLWTRAHDGFYQLGIFNRSKVDSAIDVSIFMGNGGQIIDVNRVFTEKHLKKLINDIDSLPRVIEIDRPNHKKVGIIHAHMPFKDWNTLHETDLSLDELDEILLWEHAFFKGKEYEDENAYTVKNIDKIYHGHTVIPDVIEFANRVYIDTGSFLKYKGGIPKNYKGEITILEI
jgi:serine/threonine protein phosphatase 1